LHKRGEAGLAFRVTLGRSPHERTDAPHPLRLLRARRKRPRGHPTKNAKKLPSSHVRPSDEVSYRLKQVL
jgi:hypothetical protein